jgi:hypothetical protein
VATSDERNGRTDAGTVITVARGNRLEASGTQLRSANGGVKEKIFSNCEGIFIML